MKPLVSIIIPCYNAEEFVGEAIESALNQTESECEVIVIDDGSSDKSTSVIESFGGFIRFSKISNSGVSKARNRGLAMSQGLHVKFLDSDDLLDKDCIRNHLINIENVQKNAILCGYLSKFNKSPLPVVQNNISIDNGIPLVDIPRIDLLANSLHVSLPLFPRNALVQIGGFASHLKRFEDYELSLRLCSAGFTFVKDGTHCIYHREHDSNDRLSKKPLATDSKVILIMFEKIVDQFKNVEPSLSNIEKMGLANYVWARGRDLLRNGDKVVSKDYFSLARGLAGFRAPKGSIIYRILCNLITEEHAEKMIKLIKTSNPLNR